MNEQLVAILHKCINGVSLTDVEQKQLNDWISQSHHNRQLYDEINSETFRRDVKKILGYDGKAIWKKFSEGINSQQPKRNLITLFHNTILRYVAAAVLLVLISTTAYMLFVKPTTHQQKAVSDTPPPATLDVSPGAEKATLTLDNGTNLVLDNASSGKIAEQGNTIVVKEEGLLSYNSYNNGSSNNIFYNTLTTARGSYYSSLVLADGSKVWLNAQSSIRFPTAFPGKDRVVEVTGEVYFEVAKNASKPFKVNVRDKGMVVEVLGTHFNINAYVDEAEVKTTLLEGAVKIVSGSRVNFLKPGQQAINSNGETRVVNDADVDEAIAWKNGMFQFQNADIRSIMRQVEKWYDAEVVYDGNVDRKFFAEIPRTVEVSRLLTILKKTGWVDFKIEGKKIIVIAVK